MEQVRAARSGFSLIEIMVVVLIMGILAALVVPGVWTYLRRAQIKTTRVAVKNIQNAINAFYADTGVYPSSLNELRERPSDEKVARRWEGPYITGAPNDAWGHELMYEVKPKGSRPPFELYSWGPNGEGSPQEEWLYVQEE